MASSCSVGRPSLNLDLEKVEAMRNSGLSMTKISKTLGISRSMLYRALENLDLIGCTDINDSDLDQIILRYKQNHPHDGERMLNGHLRSSNIHVPRYRI